MSRSLRLVGLLALLLLATPAAHADICEDVNDLANAWNAVANALEQDASEDVGDLDVERLENDVNALLDPTQTLGEALIDMGNDTEAEIGNDLLEIVEDMLDVAGDDLASYLVDVIDDLVDTLDGAVDYCDAG